MLWNKFIISIWAGIFFSIPAFSLAQENLIVNGNCDSIINCPTQYSQIQRCYGWQDWSQINSCDYYNTCSTQHMTVPGTEFGFQYPQSGNGYIGMLQFEILHNVNTLYKFFQDANGFHEYRECAIGTLKAPLQKGRYQFQCYVNFYGYGRSGDGRVAINAFDLIFLDSVYHPLTSTLPYIDTSQIIDLNPSGQILNDTTNWIPLTICYDAKGGEKYFAVGTFRDSLNITQFEFYGNSGDPSIPYLADYIYDSFSLYACDTCCGNEPPEPDENAVIIGNGTSADVGFKLTLHNGSEADLLLYDCLGKLILYHRFNENESDFTLPQTIERAMYHYVIESTKGFRQMGKLMKM